jgi:alkylhydroperoxidase family enzyme
MGVSGNSRRRLSLACLACASLATVAALGAQGGSKGARIAPVPENQRTDEQKAIAAQFTSAAMPNFVGTLLNYPALAKGMLPHERYITNDSTLPPRHRVLLGLRTAWLTRSSYLWAHRAGAAKRAGFTDEEIARIARGPEAPGWDAFDAALLRAADELHVDSFISDATWKALSTRYDTNQLIDTIDTVGATTIHAGVINSLGVEIESGVAERPPSAIPYSVAATRTNIRLQGREPRIPPVESPGGRGGGANVFRTFVRNPPADRVRGAINTLVNSGSSLSPRQRELLLMRIGVLCRSEYEYAAHHRVGRGAGMTEADVARILAGPASSGDAVDTALLRATDELFEDDVITADTWAALAKTFNTRQLFDVLIAVGGYRSTSMLINSAGVQLDANMADFRFPPALR